VLLRDGGSSGGGGGGGAGAGVREKRPGCDAVACLFCSACKRAYSLPEGGKIGGGGRGG